MLSERKLRPQLKHMMRNQQTSRARVHPRSDGSRSRPAKPAKRPPRDNRNNKLTPEDVIEIRRLRPTTILRKIAARFNVSIAAISAVCQGHSYPGIGGDTVSGPGRIVGRVGCAPKPSRWARRQTRCTYCREDIPINGAATRAICDSCALGISRRVIIYDRDAGIGEIPEDLRRRYSLSG
jgi:hypothetical protein